MNNNLRAYIAGAGTVTAIGGDSNMNYHSVKAGISGYQSANYFTQSDEHISMALVPEKALPPLLNEFNVRGELSFRVRRILRMCHVAAEEAMAGFTGKTTIPLIFAAPTNEVSLSEQFPARFIHYLAEQTGLPIDPRISRLIGTGRSGVLDALALALRYLYEGDFESILIGGGDSYQHTELLAALDKEARILAPGVMNGFAPGEGASFVLLTRDPSGALRTETHLLSLRPPGVANEPGHLFSNEPYRGDGLAQAFKQALATSAGEVKICDIYSSMNGEQYWAKEYGVARMRHQDYFEEAATLHHPADCYGDLGAATGAALINLAVQAQLNGQPAKPSLIYCSSDHRCRAAVRFEPISVASVQALQSTPLTRHVSS